VPYLHDSLAVSFSIFIFKNLPLALVSFLRVEDVIVNGLNAVVTCVSCGYLLTPSVTFALPCNDLKSGTNLRKARKASPASFSLCPLCLDSKSISNDFIKEVRAVVVPFGFT